MSSTPGAGSPNKRLRKHSQNEFLSLMITAKRLPSSSYSQITELNLSNLQLIKIDTFPFAQLPQLLSLDLSHNQLVSIQADWSTAQPNGIEKLNVSHNKLETLLFLKDFQSLKSFNLTENLLRTNERFLSLCLCPQLEHLIDANQEQIDDDQLKLDQWSQLMETKIDRIWALSYNEKYQQEAKSEKSASLVKKLLDDFRHAMIRIFEKQPNFSQIHLSPLANYLLGKKIEELCSAPVKLPAKKSLKTHLTADFTQLMETKNAFEPVKFLRCHQNSDQDLTSVPVRMCAFEPNTSKHRLVTCGGQKVCFIDCELGEVTHLYEVSALRSTAMPTTRKLKDKSISVSSEYFSCLCWMEIPATTESIRAVAVGATNGHIYLLSAQWKVMFGHIELPNASISCLTWHGSDPSTLIIGSYQSVRYLNIQPYLDRLQAFVKQSSPLNSIPCKVSITQTYHLDHGDGSLIRVTDLLVCEPSLLLVGTTSGLFVIRNQSPMKLNFPKSMCTVGEQIESIRLVDPRTRLIAMNILGLDQICCFDLEQSLPNRQLHVVLTLPNPYRQIASQMAVWSTEENGMSFECILGSDHGSFFFHQVRGNATTTKKGKRATFDHKHTEIRWPPEKSSSSSSLLSASLDEQYLCLTTNNNLICIYQRK